MAAAQMKWYKILQLLSGIAVALYACSYLGLEVKGLLNLKSEELLSSNLYLTLLYVHIVSGIIAIVTGPIQFFNEWRNKNLGKHRWIGKLYVIAVFVSGVCGIYIGLHAYGGTSGKIGFILSDIAWLGTTYLAYNFAVVKKINLHRRWMIRSYALTAFAITFRIWLGIGDALNIGFNDIYQIAPWIWIINLSIAEIYIRRKTKEVEG